MKYTQYIKFSPKFVTLKNIDATHKILVQVFIITFSPFPVVRPDNFPLSVNSITQKRKIYQAQNFYSVPERMVEFVNVQHRSIGSWVRKSHLVNHLRQNKSLNVKNVPYQKMFETFFCLKHFFVNITVYSREHTLDANFIVCIIWEYQLCVCFI